MTKIDQQQKKHEVQPQAEAHKQQEAHRATEPAKKALSVEEASKPNLERHDKWNHFAGNPSDASHPPPSVHKMQEQRKADEGTEAARLEVQRLISLSNNKA